MQRAGNLAKNRLFETTRS